MRPSGVLTFPKVIVLVLELVLVLDFLVWLERSHPVGSIDYGFSIPQPLLPHNQESRTRTRTSSRTIISRVGDYDFFPNMIGQSGVVIEALSDCLADGF